jgi:amphi-Trp domain-containing protein
MRDIREFAFDGTYTRDELADVVLRLAAGIRAGGVSLSMGEDEVIMFPRGELELEVAARTKKGKSRLDIAIAWRETRGDLPAGPSGEDAADDLAQTDAGNPQSETAVAASPPPAAGGFRAEAATEETSRWARTRGSSSKGRPPRPRRPRS